MPADRPYSFRLRPATAVDQPAIKQLIRDAGINPLGLHWSRFLVAVDNRDALIGCGQVKAHGDGSRELASIAVVPAWRGQEVARALIEALLAQHGPPLWLTCMDRLVPFYARFGFSEVESAEQMPPYFRRAARFFNLYLRLSAGNGRLAVMVWTGPG
jgi:N-acetylglutamate synthase-like GNAT family acetyltransferase